MRGTVGAIRIRKLEFWPEAKALRTYSAEVCQEQKKVANCDEIIPVNV